MQISSKLFNQQQLKQFSSTTEELQDLQNKIATGENILRASDDPVGSVELSGLNVVKKQIESWMTKSSEREARANALGKVLKNQVCATLMKEGRLDIKSTASSSLALPVFSKSRVEGPLKIQDSVIPDSKVLDGQAFLENLEGYFRSYSSLRLCDPHIYSYEENEGRETIMAKINFAGVIVHHQYLPIPD